MDEKEFNYINAIPLIDVMLVLLTITLTTATFISQGAIKINLPTASSSVDKEPVIVNVYMTGEKKIIVDSVEVTEETLKTELSKYDHKTATVVISADKFLTIDDLTKVMGSIQDAGFAKMSIKTELPLSN